MSERARNLAIWAVMLAIIGVLAWRFAGDLVLGSGRLKVVTDGLPADTVEFRWSGKIDQSMPAQISAALNEWRPQKRRIILVLSSPGGSISHGARVVRLLREARSTHVVDTMVEGGEKCASMCVPIYLQGGTRYAAPRAQFMFHEISVRDAVTDERVAASRDRIAKGTDQLFERFFRPAGVPDAWITKMRRDIVGRDVWRTGRELANDGSKIVQKLE